jgi:SnoaL-like domain
MSADAAIRRLYTVYTYNGDRGRLDDLAACFAEDGTLEFPGGKGTGPEGVAAALASGIAGDPERTFTRHHVTNPMIDISEDGQSAKGRAYFSVYCNNGLDHVGTYNDTLRLTPVGWRFTYRQVRIDWQSPTSMSPPIITR